MGRTQKHLLMHGDEECVCVRNAIGTNNMVLLCFLAQMLLAQMFNINQLGFVFACCGCYHACTAHGGNNTHAPSIMTYKHSSVMVMLMIIFCRFPREKQSNMYSITCVQHHF